jgi:NADH-quinone oxidoreductase subunit N
MNTSEILSNMRSILPLTLLMTWACALLLVDVWIPKGRKWLTAALAALGLALTLGFTLAQIGGISQPIAFGGMVVVDGFAIFMDAIFLTSGIVGIALAYDYLKRMGLERGEYYVLLLFTVGGMMTMAVAADLIVVFLALEWLSIPLYVLAGFARPRLESEEAALKYFLLGAYSGGFVVYGVALVFGATGTTALAKIVAAVNAGSADMTLLLIGAALILIGIGFKVSAVPFHMWTPDVYQGAPSPVTAFMAVGAKAGGFAALLRVFVGVFPVLALDLTPVFWSLATLTMILGNLLAIAQGNIKRMLAYSSIAHAGYILMSLVPFGQESVAKVGVASALFYLFTYAFTNFTAWAVVIAMEKAEGQGLRLEDFAGLGRKYPILAAAMAISMLSFTGVPPTLGFVGKLYLFRTVLQGGFPGLAIIGVLTSLISAYYYLRVVVIMYMQDGDPQARSETWLNLTAAVSALGTFLLFVFANTLFTWASQATLVFF